MTCRLLQDLNERTRIFTLANQLSDAGACKELVRRSVEALVELFFFQRLDVAKHGARLRLGNGVDIIEQTMRPILDVINDDGIEPATLKAIIEQACGITVERDVGLCVQSKKFYKVALILNKLAGDTVQYISCSQNRIGMPIGTKHLEHEIQAALIKLAPANGFNITALSDRQDKYLMVSISRLNTVQQQQPAAPQ